MAQLAVGVVEGYYIGPVGHGRHELALGIVLVPVGVLGDEGVVAAGVVGHPVEYHLEAQVVGGLHEMLQVG